MLRLFEKTGRRPWLSSLFLLALGIGVFALRNADPVLQPVLYAEDGTWLSLALNRGWAYAFWHARPDYFVWGNLIAVWVASSISTVFCGGALACYPQSLAVVSYAFFSSLAVVSFMATRSILPPGLRALLFILVLLLPLGNSSNEILGRASNIGFFFVFLVAVLLFWRERLDSVPRRVTDGIIVLSAGTNPVCIPLIFAAILVPHFRSHSKELAACWRTNRMVLAGTTFVTLLIVSRYDAFMPGPASGVRPENLIEVILARATFYPFLFSIYSRLSDQVVIAISSALSAVLLCLWRFADRGDWRKLAGISLSGFGFFLCFLVFARGGMHGGLGGYQTTYPDRYFAGLNLLVLVIFLIVAGAALSSRGAIRWLGAVTLGAVILGFGSSLSWLFEAEKPRFAVVGQRTFPDEACLSSLFSSITRNRVTVLSNLWGGAVAVPAEQLEPLSGRTECGVLRDAFFKSNTDWAKGLSRTSASFFLPASPSYAEVFVPGQSVLIAGKDRRTVLSLEQRDDRFIITLNGDSLSPKGILALLADMTLPELPDYSRTVLEITGHGWVFGRAHDWVKGIAQKEAGLMLPNTRANLGAFRPEAIVQLATGERRRVLHVKPISHLLWVSLEGSPLNAETTGYPHQLEIVK